MYYDLKTGKVICVKESNALKFLYNNILGRLFLKIATSHFVANMIAIYMNSKLSRHKIKKFIKKNNINMEEYEDKYYKSFNDFFMRRIKDNKRIIGDQIISVCDSKLSVYKISDNTSFKIKNSIYTVEELIGESDTKYKYACVFRLCVDDYHHYVYPDDGCVVSTKFIKGKLHTVQPIALKKYRVFTENSRCVTVLDCKTLGRICYIEVGAMIIGKIVNENKKIFKKGEEKGHFEFGGSTIVLLFEKEIDINNIIMDNTNKEIETIVKLGENIGR